MKTGIVVQPTRFDIVEELGCASTGYSYVGYIIFYVPTFIPSLGCAILARKSSYVAIPVTQLPLF